MSPSYSGQFCLIVDDSRAVRQITRRTLGEAGLRVMEVADVLNGLKAILKEKVGIKLRPVILCHTDNEPDRITAAIEADAQELIMKPVAADILIGKMSDVAMPSGGGT